MKKITIIAKYDTEGFFTKKAGEVIHEIDGENVTKITADSDNIIIYFENGLCEAYHTERVRMEAE